MATKKTTTNLSRESQMTTKKTTINFVERTESTESIDNYYALVLLIEAENTNPQGDPDAENRPRQLPDGRGLITASGIKRKIRDFLSMMNQPIFVARQACLETQCINLANKNDMKKPKKDSSPEYSTDFTKALTKEYFDVRAFGQLVTRPGSKIRGPVQFSDGISIHPVEINDFSITRCAVTTEDESKNQDGGNQTMGSKSSVRYGLYRFDILVNPHDAARTGYTEDDHKVLIDTILKVFQNDASSGRMLRLRALHQFSMHKLDKAGQVTYAPMQHILDRVEVQSAEEHPTSFADYQISLDRLSSAIGRGLVDHQDLLEEANAAIFEDPCADVG